MYSSETFYTKFAQSYSRYASTKKVYLSAVNNFIARESKKMLKMIDVGSGDGVRSEEIADLIKASELTLFDSSHGMVSLLKNVKKGFVVFDDISDIKFKPKDKFGVVTCLWNVLGHIPTCKKRKSAMENLKELLAQDGVIFIDVNNRYNISQYGLWNVLRNVLRDIIHHKKTNGNFKLRFQSKEGEMIETEVHIFSPFEMNELIRSIGLKIIQRKVINYKTGKECKSIFGGQLVYKLSKL